MADSDSFPSSTGVPAGEVRKVDASRAIEWLRQGWRIFVANPGAAIVIALIVIVVSIVLNAIPFVGMVANALLMPIVTGGLMLGCRDAAAGSPLRVDHLFAGFRTHATPLLTIGAFYMLGWIAVFGTAFAIGAGGAITGAMMGRGAEVGFAAGGVVVGLIVMIAAVVLIMAMWFAPALVVFRGVPALESMKLSFAACARNLLPFLVYGLLTLIAFFIAVIPMALGLLVLLPVAFGSIYAAYRDIFGE